MADPAVALSNGKNSVPRISQAKIQRGGWRVADGAERTMIFFAPYAARRASQSAGTACCAPVTGSNAETTHFADFDSALDLIGDHASFAFDADSIALFRGRCRRFLFV
jgi:hypothetical protein